VRRLALAFVALVAVAAAVSGGAWWFATMPVATPTPAPEVSLADRIRWNESGAEAVLTLPGGTTMDFVKIGPGAFTMGSPFSEPGRDIDEKEHPVELTKAFWMAKHEVTQRQWMAVMDENPSRFEGDARPVDSVSWMDCRRFLSRLNKPGDIKFRLPTEAEWEYACRAGSNAAHHFGDGAAMNEYAWSGANGQNATHDVGQKKPNAWGLCDMYGNVWEWCADRYGLLSSGAATDPAGPNDGAFRVLRGGSWAEVKVSRLRSALRHRDDPDNRLDNYGFRCVRSL
jgi:formylglycine-generating enzyme required for sulfatase activity